MPNGKQIKIPFAERAGSLVHISQVQSGLHADCCCVVCGEALVAKKGLGNRAHHFSHKAAKQCNPETVLHVLGKKILANRIRNAVQNGDDIPLLWKCHRCKETHKGNLLKRARSVSIETPVGERTPDLTLFGETGEICAVIEIVVSHEPELEARKYYRARKITLVEFHLTDIENLTALREAPVLEAQRVSFCPIPKWKLRVVQFVGTPVRLGEASLVITGSKLSVCGSGDMPPRGIFEFDSNEHAEVALASLKNGSLDGLYEPEMLEGIVYPQDVADYAVRFARLGLKRYEWDFCGIHCYRWERGRKKYKRWR